MNYELNGKIFIYDMENDLKAYSNGIDSEIKIIFIGGLGCNFLIHPFTISLNNYCLEHNYEFIIPELRSHPNFGLFTIDDDVEDLNNLLNSIEGTVILVGNSTGCQDIVHYLRVIGRKNIKLVILQGAVSDVEYEEYINQDLKELLFKVKDMDPNTAFKYKSNYITPTRFLDLFSRNGKEDMFSSHLDDEFFRNLNTTGINILFVISEEDKYGIKDIESKLRLVKNSRVEKIPNGTHVLLEKDDIEMFLRFFNEEIKKSL